MINTSEYRAMAAEQHRLAGMCRSPETREQHLRLEKQFLALADHERLQAAAQPHAMHTLSAINEPGQDLAGGIQFAMMDGPTRVICWVSREALDGIDGGDPSPHHRLVCFERHRRRLERIASQKYNAGEQSPIVMSYDCSDLRRG